MANSDLSAWTPTIWAREALMHLRANLGVSRKVHRDYSKEVAQKGRVINVPVPPTLAAQTKAPGSNYTFTAVTAQTVPILLDTHSYAAFEIDDIARIQARPESISDYGKSAAIAIAEDIETRLLAEYVNAGAFVGTSGTSLTKAQILAGRRILNTNKAPTQNVDRTAVVSTKDAEAILGDLSTSNAGALNSDAGSLRDGEIGRLYGSNILESQLTPLVVTTTHGLLFHRDAIALVSRALPAPADNMGVRSEVFTDEDTGIALRVMMAFDINTGSNKVVYDVLFGIKTLRPAWVVDLRS